MSQICRHLGKFSVRFRKYSWLSPAIIWICAHLFFYALLKKKKEKEMCILWHSGIKTRYAMDVLKNNMD